MEINEELNYCLNCKSKPCKSACPLENDIPEIIQLMKQNNYKAAYNKLTETTVLSSVCGRICPHTKQCKSNCTRGIKNNAVEIGDIEAYLSDFAIKNDYKMQNFSNYEENKKKNKTVAIIGGGPAGLTCAAFLARSGVNVTIYDKNAELGGILSHGIPKFRLDNKVLKNTIKNILDLGIKVEYEKELGKNIFLEDLTKKYDFIFLSFGANISTRMNIEGECLLGVYGANEVLEKNENLEVQNKNIAVIGGGNVAMDMARTAKILGAKDVFVVYRRAEEQMPAETIEIQQAKEDGVKFLFQNNIIKILPKENTNIVGKIECVKTELIQKEKETRLVPMNIEGSNYMLDVDMIFMAVGSIINENLVKKLGLELTEHNYIRVNENYQTSNKKIFAGGDLIGQKSTVAWAARTGRQSASEILKNIK